MAATKTRASKTKTVNGRVVSAKSKTGDPACSQAMSEWKTTGLTPAISAILGKCRAKARALKQGESQRAAGNEAKAQRLEALAAGKKGPITAKDRLAKAKELVAQRRASKRPLDRYEIEARQGKGFDLSPRQIGDRAVAANAERIRQRASTSPNYDEKIGMAVARDVAKHQAQRGTPDRLARAAKFKASRARDRENLAQDMGKPAGAKLATSRWTAERLAKAKELLAQRAAARTKPARKEISRIEGRYHATETEKKHIKAGLAAGHDNFKIGRKTYKTVESHDSHRVLEVTHNERDGYGKVSAASQRVTVHYGDGAASKAQPVAPKPSLRAQADAYRGMKGTAADRLAKAKELVTARAGKGKAAPAAKPQDSRTPQQRRYDRLAAENFRNYSPTAVVEIKRGQNGPSTDYETTARRRVAVAGIMKKYTRSKQAPAAEQPGRPADAQGQMMMFGSPSPKASGRNTPDRLAKAKELRAQRAAARSKPAAPVAQNRPSRESQGITLEKIGGNSWRGSASAYVAEITGRDPKYKMAREFQSGKRDYSGANSNNSRGVTETYSLQRGKVYEVNEPKSWKNADRYVVTPRAGGLKKVTPERAVVIAERFKALEQRRLKASTQPIASFAESPEVSSAPAKPSRSRPDASHGERVRAAAARLKAKQAARVAVPAVIAKPTSAPAPRPPKGDYQERARKLAVIAQKRSQSARASSLAAAKRGNEDLSAKRDAAYRVNFQRSENLAIASGYRQPKAAKAQTGVEQSPSGARWVDAQPVPAKPSLREQAAAFRASKGGAAADRLAVAKELKSRRAKSRLSDSKGAKGLRVSVYKDNASDAYGRGKPSREATETIERVRNRIYDRQDRNAEAKALKVETARTAADTRRFGKPLDYKERAARIAIAGQVRVRRSKGGDWEGKRISQIPISEKLTNARKVIASRVSSLRR